MEAEKSTRRGKAKYDGWDKKRRFEGAVRAVVHDHVSQVQAAKDFGVSRSHLNIKVKAYQEKFDARMEATRIEAAGPALLGAVTGAGQIRVENERRRVPATFQEFDDYYFSNWQCPDCNFENHERKPFHDEIVDAVMGDHRRVVINVPPFHAKSTYATVKSTVFAVVRNPNIRRIIVSKSTDFAKTFLYSINELLTNPDLYSEGRNLIEDWGPFKGEGSHNTWNQNKIYVAGRLSAEKDPTVQVAGVGTTIYGKRADEIIADDVADLDNQRNPENVRKMLEWFDKMASSRVGKSGKIVWIGTRVSAGDIYATLKQRPGYKVISKSAILDDLTEEVLWPEHFPYSQLLLHRSEMTTADFQLVYQNVDTPGLGASFTQEMIDACKDQNRVVGHYESGWRVVAGVDPAGANKDSGYTALTVVGVDTRTQNRFLIDQIAVKSMKAPQLRDQMFDWTDRYPISEWRVEVNGVQAQLIQYNDEIRRYLTSKGVRVVPHTTHKNKWDPQFGVESMAPMYANQMMSIPWGNAPTAAHFQPFIEQLIAFPMGAVNDRVMSSWFTELGIRDYLHRGHLPLFNERMKVPPRIRRRRHVVDFEKQEVRGVPLHEQRRTLWEGQQGVRRLTVGRPTGHPWVEEEEPLEEQGFINVAGTVGR